MALWQPRLGIAWDLFGTAEVPWTPMIPHWAPYIQAVLLLLGLFFISVGAGIDFELLFGQPGMIFGLAAGLMGVKLAILLVLVSDLRSLLGYLGLTLSLSAAVTVSCLFVLRRRHGAGQLH